MENLASVATNYDPNLTSLIAEVVWEIGEDGMIEIEPGNELRTHLFVIYFVIFIFLHI